MAEFEDKNWQKNCYTSLNKRLVGYTIQIQDIFSTLNKEACLIADRTAYNSDADKPFSFNDYPETKAAVERLKKQYIADIRTAIISNTAKEWNNSNVVQDLLATNLITKTRAQIDGKKRTTYYQTNSKALQAFQNRKINKQGTLSQNLWKQSDEHLKALEASIGTAIKKGTSAVTLSKQVAKYLRDFDSLRKDFKETYGKEADIKNCEYRAVRLARSEINMAYRSAEQERWKQMDFVLGYEIQLSKNHNEADICDDLAGRYPKDFVWTGWHPNDKCFAVPIMMTPDDFIRLQNGESTSVKPINDVPQAFKDWVKDNADKIQTAKSVPYFVKDNKEVVNGIIGNKSILQIIDNSNTKQNTNETPNFNAKLTEYKNIKPKRVSTEPLIFTDFSGGVVPLAYNSFRKAAQLYYNTKANTEKTAILKSIVANENFTKLEYHSTKDNSIFGINLKDFDCALSEKEMPKNIAIAKKFVKNKCDVYLLSNPTETKSADFIIERGGKLYYVEGKTSSGGSSLIERLKEGARQSERIAVNFTSYPSTKDLIAAISEAFNKNSNLYELILFKSSRMINIKRHFFESKDFEDKFIKYWTKSK